VKFSGNTPGRGHLRMYMGVAKGGVSPSPSSSSLSSPRSISWLIYATRRRRQLATICRKQKRQIEIAQLGRRKNGGEENKIVNKISAGRLVAHCYPFRRCFIEHPALSQFESVSESESESQALFPSLSQSLSASISQSSVLPFLRIELPCNISCFFRSRWLSPSYFSFYTMRNSENFLRFCRWKISIVKLYRVHIILRKKNIRRNYNYKLKIRFNP